MAAGGTHPARGRRDHHAPRIALENAPLGSRRRVARVDTTTDKHRRRDHGCGKLIKQGSAMLICAARPHGGTDVLAGTRAATTSCRSDPQQRELVSTRTSAAAGVTAARLALEDGQRRGQAMGANTPAAERPGEGALRGNTTSAGTAERAARR
jgi:hypothetical protein